MIKIVWSINDINKYQTGNLLDGAVKIETPQSVGELMKKAVPIAVILCVILFIAMLCKTIICKTVVISPIFILVGFAFGFLLLIIHEWLHGIVYPKEADVTIGRIKGKATFVALIFIFPRYSGDGFEWTCGEEGKNRNTEKTKRISEMLHGR